MFLGRFRIGGAAATTIAGAMAVFPACTSGGPAGLAALDGGASTANAAGTCEQTQALPSASCGNAEDGASCAFADGAYCVTTYGDTGRCATEYFETCCGGRWQSSAAYGTHPSSGRCPDAPVEGASCRSAVDDCGSAVPLDCTFTCANGSTARGVCSDDALHVTTSCAGTADAGVDGAPSDAGARD